MLPVMGVVMSVVMGAEHCRLRGDGRRALVVGAPAITRNIGVFLKLLDENMYDSLCHDHTDIICARWHAVVCRACLNWQPGKGVSE